MGVFNINKFLVINYAITYYKNIRCWEPLWDKKIKSNQIEGTGETPRNSSRSLLWCHVSGLYDPSWKQSTRCREKRGRGFRAFRSQITSSPSSSPSSSSSILSTFDHQFVNNSVETLENTSIQRDMGNLWSTVKEPPPPMVLVPPLFDFPPLAARTRFTLI